MELFFLLAFAAGAVAYYKKGADVKPELIGTGETPQTFLSQWAEAAKTVDWRGIPPAFALAVSKVETGNGSATGIWTKSNNLFSITKGSWSGALYTTTDGRQFRKYVSFADSMRDFVGLLHFHHYQAALAAALNQDMTGFATALKAEGYDESNPNYAALVIGQLPSAQEALA